MLVKIDVGRLINPHASGLLPISSLDEGETSYTLSWCNATQLELMSPSHPRALAICWGGTWGLLRPHKGRFASQNCSGDTKTALMYGKMIAKWNCWFSSCKHSPWKADLLSSSWVGRETEGGSRGNLMWLSPSYNTAMDLFKQQVGELMHLQIKAEGTALRKW